MLGACAVTWAREVTHKAPAELGSERQPLTAPGGPWGKCSRKGHNISQGLVARKSSQEWPEGREHAGLVSEFLRAGAPRYGDPVREH